MPLSVRKVLAPLRSFLDQIFKLTKLPVNDRHGQNLINDCILSARVAEPPDFWAAPAPDQNFGGSGSGPAPAPARPL